MRISRVYLFVSIAILSFIATSCYKESTYTTKDYDLTITSYDVNFDFSKYKTFYIRDSVAMISDYIEKGDKEWKDFYKTGGISDQIKFKIRQEYAALGYTEVHDTLHHADFAVNMVITLSKITSAVYYPGYWWGYPSYWDGYYPYYFKKGSKNWGGYWGGYWGDYYPWYGSGYSYTYKTGTLMIEMADGDALRAWIHYIQTTPNPSPSDPKAPKLKFVWSAFINGLQDDNTNMERLNNGIDEAFKNSPYLKRN